MSNKENSNLQNEKRKLDKQLATLLKNIDECNLDYKNKEENFNTESKFQTY
jgi:peptidoglycan hydrolase CwlO-like protein